MARGKYLSLEEARRTGRLDQFAKEHPAEGDWQVFDALFEAMATGEPPTRRTATAGETSSQAASACCGETQTRRDTSEDA